MPSYTARSNVRNTKVLAAPATAGVGCAAADVQLGRLIAVQEAAPIAIAVEQEMLEAWPVLVDAAVRA